MTSFAAIQQTPPPPRVSSSSASSTPTSSSLGTPSTPPIDQVLSELMHMSRDINRSFGGGQVSPLPPASPRAAPLPPAAVVAQPAASQTAVVTTVEFTPALLRTRVYEALLRNPEPGKQKEKECREEASRSSYDSLTLSLTYLLFFSVCVCFS